jgi:CubicO group peptidase (beta-lactamase class C family)
MGARGVSCGWICLVAAASVLAAEPNSDASAVQALDAYIGAHAANGDFSGIVRVSRRGERIYEKTIGFASRGFDVPIAPDTRFVVASVTKTFTAAGIQLLVDQGKLKIEDGLEAHLPEFPYAKKIKIWHLLAHQSGLSNPDYEAIAAREVSPAGLVDLVGAAPLLFEPGSETRYSNAGYIVLARVIEKVGGKPFGEFLSERIFAKLGMANSGTLASGAIVPRLAEGYVPGVGDGFLSPQPRDPSSLFGSGNVYSTAADLDRWLTAIDRRELFDIGKQVYPFGWGKRAWFDRDVLVQSGITNGYSSIILTVPAEELHVVVLMNTQSGFTGDEGRTLLGILLGQPAPVPARRGAPAKVTRAQLERHAGDYLWGEGKVPMHLQTNGATLTLRWADSASVVPLTPLGEAEFLDRTSLGRIRFGDDGLVWTQNGEDTIAPRAPRPEAASGTGTP